MRAEEESLHAALEQCVRAMGGRGEERGSTMQDRVNELWVLIAQKKARRQGFGQDSVGYSGGGSASSSNSNSSGQAGGQGHAEWAVANEGEAIKVLQVCFSLLFCFPSCTWPDLLTFCVYVQVLAQQQRTLNYLTEVVKNDAAVLDVVKQGFGEAPVSGSLGHAQ